MNALYKDSEFGWTERIRTIFIAIFLTVAAIGCPLAYSLSTNNHEEIQVLITKGDDGKQIAMMVGSLARLELPVMGGTGYTWQLNNLDKEYIEIIKEETTLLSEMAQTGSPINHMWTLKARKAGTTDITFACYRDWEGIGKAADNFRVKIIIDKNGMKEK